MSETSELKEELPQRASKFPRLTVKAAQVLLQGVTTREQVVAVVRKQVSELQLDVTPKQVNKQVLKLLAKLPDSGTDTDTESDTVENFTPLDFSKTYKYADSMTLQDFAHLSNLQQRRILWTRSSTGAQPPASFRKWLQEKKRQRK